MRQQRAKEMAEGVDVSVLLGGLALANNADLYPAHSQVKAKKIQKYIDEHKLTHTYFNHVLR